jgi:hypothetical protein
VNSYQPGDSIRISAQVLVLGVLTDPTSIELELCQPGGTIVPFLSPAHDGVGLYHVDYIIPYPAGPIGDWLYRWITTGSPTVVNGVIEGAFSVGALSF